MKRLLAGLAVSAALCLSACNTTSLTPSLSPAAQLDTAKGLNVAEHIFNVAANGYLIGESHLTIDQKAWCKKQFKTLNDLRKAAEAADTLGDTATLSAKITAMQTLAKSISAVTGASS